MNTQAPALGLRTIVVTMTLLFSGCLAAFPDNASLPIEQACLISAEQAVPITLEIAKSPNERSRGLMARERLAPDAGMLFVYNNPRGADHGFWMYRTLIPLDIAYLDRNGIIRSIRQMAPCPAEKGRDCPTYPAGVPFYLALEMNQNFFESRGIAVGDRLSRESSDCR